jgi:hypothetical protein
MKIQGFMNPIRYKKPPRRKTEKDATPREEKMPASRQIYSMADRFFVLSVVAAQRE